MTLATLQHLRSFAVGEHPLNLEPGQLAFNMATPTIYIYVGNGTSNRIDETGTVLATGGETGKGWVRYSLKNPEVPTFPNLPSGLSIESVNDTTLMFKLTGTDGIVRSATITLS